MTRTSNETPTNRITTVVPRGQGDKGRRGAENRVTRLGLAFLALLTASASVVSAADDIFCASYAQKAVAQFNRAQSTAGCQSIAVPPAWSGDYAYHFSWCIGATIPQALADVKTQRREEELANCGGQPTTVPACERYALAATGQNRENIDRECGFRGSAWSSEYNGHYDWCVWGNNRDRIEAETSARERALENDCLTGKGDLAAHSWCYTLPQSGPGQVVTIEFHPIVREAAGRRWTSRREGSYTVGANVGPQYTEARPKLLGYPHWRLGPGEAKILPGVELPFAATNRYHTFGAWVLDHPDDTNRSNDSLGGRVASVEGREFLPGGALSVMRCPTQGGWPEVPRIKSLVAPALASLPSRLHLVALLDDGSVVYTWTDGPGRWGGLQLLGAAIADPDSTPVLLADPANNQLFAFVRSKTDELLAATLSPAGTWSGWTSIVGAGEVRGRVSAGITAPAMGGVPELHLLFRTDTNGTPAIAYRRFDPFLLELARLGPLNGFEDGVLVTDGVNDLAIFVSSDKDLRIFQSARPWPALQDQTPGSISSYLASRKVLDLSNAVFLNQEYHLALDAERFAADFAGADRGQELSHLRVPQSQPQSLTRTVVATGPSGSTLRASLAAYREKLVLAYADASGDVRFSRLDSADPSLPWIGGGVVREGSKTDARPALAAFDRRSAVPAPNWDRPNFGDDLFAGIRDRRSSGLAFLNLSRTVMVADLQRQLKLYDSRTGTNNCNQDGQYGGTPCPAPVLADLATEDRPLVTEVGYMLWTLPHWLSGDVYREWARRACEVGNTSRRFDPPCSAARYPILFAPIGSPGNSINIGSGIWLRTDNQYENVWEELGHSIVGPMGLDVGPEAWNADVTGISLAALKEARTLFAASGWPRPGAGRRLGCTNRNCDGIQHSFIYTMFFYFSDGDQLRTFIQQDQANGTSQERRTLLQRKYDWVRTNIFRGVEFTLDNRVRR
ncbi:MAG: hypothetical protein K8J08_06205 [Thermoanaerobaculia bacterium]|nr:hypothetical protein [Thermoanaerobaculia bacterium]